MPGDPSLLEKLRQIPGCKKLAGDNEPHWFAIIWADECDECLQKLVDTLSHQARQEVLEEAAAVLEDPDVRLGDARAIFVWEGADILRSLKGTSR